MRDMSGREALGVGIVNTAILGCLFDHLIRNRIIAGDEVKTILRQALNEIGTGMMTPAVQAREIIAEFNTRISKSFIQDSEED